MCGIFAYSGNRKNAAEIVISGLKKLEYRGYDSWGIAYKVSDENGKEGHKLEVLRNVGKIGDFDLGTSSFPQSSLAIGHSRWATHGGVTLENAHPHSDEKHEISVVHNGIIENYRELKKELIEKGHIFKSQTDTEVIVHLIEDYAKSHDFVSAVKKALKRLEGRYAILAIKVGEQKMVAARRGSPLIVGIGVHEYFIASDIPAFLEYTRNIMYLDDDEMVVVNDAAHFYNTETNEEIYKRIIEIDWTPESAEKGDFKHFMIKEIMEQKDTIYRAIHQNDEEILRLVEEIKNAYGTYLVGCGTAGKVCMAASYLFSKIAKRHVNVVFGSEFPSYSDFLKEKSLVIAISQSGETAEDTIGERWRSQKVKRRRFFQL